MTQKQSTFEKLLEEARCLTCEKPCDPLMYFCQSCHAKEAQAEDMAEKNYSDEN